MIYEIFQPMNSRNKIIDKVPTSIKKLSSGWALHIFWPKGKYTVFPTSGGRPL
jgi:hypothetical protein